MPEQLVNIEYFNNLKASINSCSTCDELRELSSKSLQSIADIQASIVKEMAAIEPILALLQPPNVNPAAIVTWITSLITNVLTPMYKPYLTYSAQIPILTTQIAELTAAIQSASGRFPNCSIP